MRWHARGAHPLAGDGTDGGHGGAEVDAAFDFAGVVVDAEHARAAGRKHCAAHIANPAVVLALGSRRRRKVLGFDGGHRVLRTARCDADKRAQGAAAVAALLPRAS